MLPRHVHEAAAAAERRVLTVDGCPLAYTLRLPAGLPSPTPVVLIQGVAVQGEGWLPQSQGLANRFACLTFDNRGMGKSVPTGVRRVTVERMTEDVTALMDAAGWPSAHVVGHSLGGLVAQDLALRHRERVRSLSLLCTFARGRDATRLSARMFLLGLRTRIGLRAWRREAFLRFVMPPATLARGNRGVLAQRLASLFGHDLADQPPIVAEQLRAMKRYDATPRLGLLEGIPTLVAAATFDPIARPPLGRALAKGIPGARYVEFSDASHGMTIQFANRTNALLREHIDAAQRTWAGRS
jgi:pimeloyl-ACP methyl ester carboxylesterase